MLGICTNCKEHCEVNIVNNGIGPYEYWGAKGNDVQLEATSNCCDAPAIIHASGEMITVADIKAYNEYYG